MYRVELSREAQRFFEQCDEATAKKLARCFAALEADPRAGNNVKALKGPFAYIDYMRPRCVQVACVLKKTGSFYYRCGWDSQWQVK